MFEQGDAEVKKGGEKAERKMLLDAWLEFEQEQGTAASQARVKKLMPTQVKRRREVFGEDGVSGAWASGRLRRIDCCPVLPWPAATPFFFFFFFCR